MNYLVNAKEQVTVLVPGHWDTGGRAETQTRLLSERVFKIPATPMNSE